MNLNKLKEQLKHNERIKTLVHRAIISPKRCRPRLWVRMFVNPLFSKRARGSRVSWSVTLNVSPINQFALGSDSVIEKYSVIDNGVGSVVVGKNSRIGFHNTIIGPVTIGDDVNLAQNVVVSGLNHNYRDVTVPIKRQGVTKGQITIADDVWIGANSTVTAGVTIGTHSIVAGGSVVIRDVEPYSIVAGVPARVVKRYDFRQQQWVSVSNGSML